MKSDYIELEEQYAKYIGTSGCTVTNTGTSALHLALEALDLEPGDEVIVPEFTMIATAWAVVYAGLKPVFVDCNEQLLIDTDKIIDKITPRTKVIMVTHIYGRVCEMNSIIKIAEKYGLRIIEDACEAQGAYYDGVSNSKVGSYDIGCFSFYSNKIIHAEEGGAITSNDEKLLKTCKDLKSMAFGKNHDYLHGKIGFNYRMTNGQAVKALQSLKEADKNNEKRKQIEKWYNENLPDNLKMPDTRKVVWVYDIKISDGRKDDLVKFLNIHNIPARHSFKPMSMQPTFNYNYTHLKAFQMSREVCYLPVFPELTEAEVVNISKLIKDFI